MNGIVICALCLMLLRGTIHTGRSTEWVSVGVLSKVEERDKNLSHTAAIS